MLKEFIGERKSGILFVSRAGNPLCQNNILKRSLHPILKAMGREKAVISRLPSLPYLVATQEPGSRRPYSVLARPRKQERD